MFTRGSKTITSCRVKVWSPVRLGFKEEAGLPSWFSTVMCQGECVRGPFETTRLEVFEANCGVALVSRGRLSLE